MGRKVMAYDGPNTTRAVVEECSGGRNRTQRWKTVLAAGAAGGVGLVVESGQRCLAAVGSGVAVSPAESPTASDSLLAGMAAA